jgi:hypothetical protein
MKIPESLVFKWGNDFANAWIRGQVPDGARREQYVAEQAALYASEQMRERAASLCDGLRVSGGREWTEDHAGALTALTEAATAIRALKGE